jgi:hypothetical protein
MNKKDMAKLEKEFSEPPADKKKDNQDKDEPTKVTQMAALLATLLLEKAVTQAMSGNDKIDIEGLMQAFSGTSEEVSEAQAKAKPVLDAAESAMEEKLAAPIPEEEENIPSVAETVVEPEIIPQEEVAAVEDTTSDEEAELNAEAFKADLKESAEKRAETFDKAEQSGKTIELEEATKEDTAATASSAAFVKNLKESAVKREEKFSKAEESGKKSLEDPIEIATKDESQTDEPTVTISEQPAEESAPSSSPSPSTEITALEDSSRKAMIPKAISLDYGRPLPVLESDVPALRPESIPKAKVEKQGEAKLDTASDDSSVATTAIVEDNTIDSITQPLTLPTQPAQSQSSSLSLNTPVTMGEEDNMEDETETEGKPEKTVSEPVVKALKAEPSSSRPLPDNVDVAEDVPSPISDATSLSSGINNASNDDSMGESKSKPQQIKSNNDAATITPSAEQVQDVRRQPKSVEEEQLLAARYAALDSLQDRAFQILADLGMIDRNN